MNAPASPAIEDATAPLGDGSASARATPLREPWTTTQRVLFRFACVYLVLYNLPFPLAQVPVLDKLADWYGMLWSDTVPWFGAHVLRLTAPVSLHPTGSGDTAWNWVQSVIFVLLAVVGTAAWSIADRRRVRYEIAQDWLRIYVRYSLAFTMLGYGGYKVIKSQFPEASLERLVEPYGSFSPMGVLWSFMGYSTAFNVFTGLGEMVGGALLFFRRTTMLGAAILVAVLANVVTLNYAYDVPVKLYSTNLMLMALFLLAPELSRLRDLFIFNRTVAPARLGAPAMSPSWQRAWRALKPLVIAFAIASPLWRSYQGWRSYGDGAKAPALFGIWEVERFARNGDVLPPLLGDSTRWRRFIVNRTGYVSLQSMTDSVARYRLALDSTHHTLTITAFADSTRRRTFTYAQDSPAELRLDAASGGDSTHVTLRRRDERRFLLTSRGFHWINELPFNR